VPGEEWEVGQKLNQIIKTVIHGFGDSSKATNMFINYASMVLWTTQKLQTAEFCYSNIRKTL
jgi:hypothetical protein